MGSLLLAIRLVLAGVFAVAGVAKLVDRPGSERALGEFGVPAAMVPVAAVLLPLVELATAVALIPPGSARWGALAALVLLLGFVAGIANVLRRGRSPDCHCFGQLRSAPAGRRALARNAVLAVLAGVVLWRGPGPSLPAWVSERDPAEVLAVAATAVAAALGGLAARLWLERRQLSQALGVAQAEIAALPSGLPVGATAPSFALPDLDGRVRSLESLCARGLPVVLVFATPHCEPCTAMFGDFGRWQTALADRLTLAVVSDGTPEENRPLAEEHGLVNVLLQEGAEVMASYRVRAAPSALVVTPGGAIGGSVASSNLAIEPLIRLTLRRAGSAAAHSSGSIELPMT